ncbi:MAG TPA: cation-transporting P-type ATPase, partial [Bacillota bacterium]|nr:cation-transporting P-type ATPase [Bacillota bacterium]
MLSQWTTLTGEEVCRQLGASPSKGLSAGEVERRRSRWGPNLLATAGRPSLLSLFLNQFKDFMVLVLLGATLISGLLGEFSDALTILIIVILNAVLGVIQEYRAERSLEALKKMAAPRATVLREDGSLPSPRKRLSL